MSKLKIDFDLSLSLYNECKDFVHPGECYYNVAKVAIRYLKHQPQYKNIQIAFGGWEVEAITSRKVYAKHCFFILDGKVLDPTFHTRKFDVNSDYIIATTYSLPEYLGNLYKYNGDTELLELNTPIFNIFYENLLRDNIVLIG